MRSGLSAWRRQWKLLIWCGRASDWWCWWRTRRLHHAILMSTRHCDAAAGDDWCYVAIPTEFSVNEPKTVMPLPHAFFIFSIEMLAMKQVWRKIHRRGRPPNCHFLPGPHLTHGSFFGPTRVYIPNGTLIVRFCRTRRCAQITDRHTDHADPYICSNRPHIFTRYMRYDLKWPFYLSQSASWRHRSMISRIIRPTNVRNYETTKKITLSSDEAICRWLEKSW